MGSTIILFTFLTCSALLPFQEVAAARRYSPFRRQTADFNEGGLPSHLPSPPDPEDNTKKPPATLSTDGDSPQIVTMENFEMERPAPPPPEPPPPPPEGPLGLAGTILILVPGFKYTIHGFPAWAGAKVTLSFPITIFFDMLAFPPGSPPFPFPFGPWRPPRQAQRRNTFFGSGRKKRNLLSLPPPSSLQGGERALIFPRLESFLKSAGIPAGRECLLRTVCEVHETSLTEGYGLLGEFITRFFSVSRSAYADSHLPEYLKAERAGKAGDCSYYYGSCTHSLFGESVGEEEYCESRSESGKNFCGK